MWKSWKKKCIWVGVLTNTEPPHHHCIEKDTIIKQLDPLYNEPTLEFTKCYKASAFHKCTLDYYKQYTPSECLGPYSKILALTTRLEKETKNKTKADWNAIYWTRIKQSRTIRTFKNDYWTKLNSSFWLKGIHTHWSASECKWYAMFVESANQPTLEFPKC